MTEWQRTFKRIETGERSRSLREIFLRCSDEERQLSSAFYADYGSGRGTGLLTPFRGIAQGPGPLARGEALVRGRIDAADRADKVCELEARLESVFQRCLPDRQVNVAVSGGVDSWLIAAMLAKQGYEVCGWYLQTGVSGYCEQEQVERSSEALGIPYRSVPVDVKDFLDALPAFTAAVQWPIYNLHPVSKWLLADALHREGVRSIVTGDSADQVMRWDWDCDLLPLTMSCFRACGVRMIAPFLAEEVISCCRTPQQDKQPVRELARCLGVPAVKKQPTLFPPVTLPTALQAHLPGDGSAERSHAERRTCLAYTTGLLLQFVESSSTSHTVHQSPLEARNGAL